MRFLRFLLALLLLAGCGAQEAGTAGAARETAAAALEPAALAAGERLRVAATTNLIGDTVRQVAGDRVELTVLLPPGTDPHAYTATPQDMVALTNAQLIFVNGLGLEEALLPTLDEISGVPVVSINEAVTPLAEDAENEEEGEAGEHADEGAHEHTVDPHTWQDVRNVRQWALTVAEALAARDPAHAAAYRDAAAAYAAELDALHSEVAAALEAIPPERRILVTDHETFAYFAAAYGFEVTAAVIPSFSTLATLSARERAALQAQIEEANVPVLFVGNTVSPDLVQQLAQDAGIAAVPLFSDSLSAPDGPAATYVAMMRANVARIIEALQ